ncbi:hypothetical protein MNBD_ALPHA07-1757 [hydrothermal vent metagenome]|uniref:Uncharacterized protein n=1 Tax=hydrothermal vent metagenome TaxID=652676 RepID=A0A3B0RLM2_9ZZZZ
MAGDALGPVQEMPGVYLTMRYDLDHCLLSRALGAGAENFTG